MPVLIRRLIHWLPVRVASNSVDRRHIFKIGNKPSMKLCKLCLRMKLFPSFRHLFIENFFEGTVCIFMQNAFMKVYIIIMLYTKQNIRSWKLNIIRASSFHLEVNEDEFPNINNADIWPIGILIGHFYGNLRKLSDIETELNL